MLCCAASKSSRDPVGTITLVGRSPDPSSSRQSPNFPVPTTRPTLVFQSWESQQNNLMELHGADADVDDLLLLALHPESMDPEADDYEDDASLLSYLSTDWSLPVSPERVRPTIPSPSSTTVQSKGSPASVDARNVLSAMALPPTEQVLDPMAIKRMKRNARDRQRSLMKRDSVNRMRRLVQELEDRKQALLDEHNKADTAARHEYLELVQQIERLRVENNALYEEIRERDLFRNMIHTFMLEFRSPEEASVPAQFPLLDADDADECVAKTQQQVINAFYENLQRRSFSTARIFGWSDFRCKTGTAVSFAVRKTFVHSSIDELAERTWHVLRSETKMHAIVPTPLECEFHVRQELSDDAVLIDRRTRDPRVPDRRVVRTAYLSVRGQDVAGGRFVAMKTLDDPRMRLALSDSELWCDIFYWFYFTRSRGRYGEECTTVEFGGSSSYMSEEIARYWVAELVFVAIRWETAVVAPVFITNTTNTAST
ncbi:hypothetical protein PINS_up005980 [Pythium insidiosum]|nr:hypothetical protein PINS_up005980 [Pythium insidiosum]